MASFDIDAFIVALREAAQQADAAKRVRELMTEAFRDPEAVRTGMLRFSGEDEVLFEDDTVSIWNCGFDPAKHVPPHDHQTTATIGVYGGAENNHFYLVGDRSLEHKTTKTVNPGDVIAIGPEAIHSVETADANMSYAIHVYLGPLSTIDRSLFDWETGEAIPFTDENYDRLERPSANQ